MYYGICAILPVKDWNPLGSGNPRPYADWIDLSKTSLRLAVDSNSFARGKYLARSEDSFEVLNVTYIMTENKSCNYGGNDDAIHRTPFKATKIWNELIEHLQTKVEQRRRRWKFQYYENCFRGGDVVEVLHAYVQKNPHLSKDATRSQVRSLCQILLEKRVIECVAVENSKKYIFEDSNKLYRFSSENYIAETAIASPVQVERKASRRRSLSQKEKNAARRKSISFTPGAQKRFADLLMPTESPEVVSASNLAKKEEIPKKRRRFSLDAGLGSRCVTILKMF